LATGYANGGDAGSVYRFIGAAASLDLGAEDYTTANWEKITQATADFIPQLGNLTDSDSIGIGGQVVRNDLRSNTHARFDHSQTNSGTVSINAFENALIQATISTTATSSGGSSFGTGTSLAVNGTIATNMVLSESLATVTESDIVTTTGDLTVNAQNTSGIDATVLSATTTGDTAVGVTLAINTIGYGAQNILFGAIDALLNTNIGNQQPAKAEAYIIDSNVTTAGGINLTANTAERLNATISNAASSTASAFFNATGLATSAILASNMVSGQALAYMNDTSAPRLLVINSTGAVNISATDNASINSNAKIISTSSTSNDGGAAVLNESIADLLPADFTSGEGNRQIAFGQKVRLADNYMNGGNAGAVYEYLGTTQTLDLGTQDYSDLGFWRENIVTQIIPQGLNITDSDSIGIGGMVVRNDLRSDVDAYLLNTTMFNAGSLSINAIDNATLNSIVDSTVSSSGGSAYGSGTSLAVNGTIATNTVLSAVDAYLDNSTPTTVGNLDIVATNSSTLNATNNNATNSGDTAVGVSLAFNTMGYTPQNTLFNAIDGLLGTDISTANPIHTHAYIIDSVPVIGGDTTISATNSSNLTAVNGNESTSNASALVNATGLAASGTLASNLVNSDTQAFIDYRSSPGTIAFTGGLALTAQDTSSINATNTLVASSTTTNDAGASIINTLANKLINEYDYTTNSGTRDIDFGEKVRVAAAYAGGGTPEEVYQYMGQDGSVNLGTQDYSDFGLWKLLKPTNVVPSGLNVTGSDSIAVGAIISRNDVRANVDTFINNQTINVGGDFSLTALEDASITSSITSVASSSGGSAYGTGTSLAINGTIATNLVLSEANAKITNAIVTVTNAGNLTLDAQNDSNIDATVNAATMTGDTGIGVVLAFNTIGWQAQNVLFNAIDALIGTDIGTEQPARARAYIADATVNVAGNVNLIAKNEATITSLVSNEVTSQASALIDATGLSATAVVASNMVSAEAKAFIDNDVFDGADILDAAILSLPFFAPAVQNNPFVPQVTITAGGTLLLDSDDNSRIDAETKSISRSSTSNTGGVDIVAAVFSILDDYQFTTQSGTRSLNSIDYQFQSNAGSTALATSNRVLVSTGHTAGGDVGKVYQYLGNAATVDLANEDFTGSNWLQVRRSTDKVRLQTGYGNGGTPGGVYRFIGPMGDVDLGAEDYDVAARWERITNDTADYIPTIGNITGSDSIGLGGVVARNDVRTDTESKTDVTTITVGALNYSATENALIESRIESTATSSGGSAFGTGTSLAVNGTIATNLVQAQANAFIENSTLTTTTGDVSFDAKQTSGIDATVLNATTTGDTAVGVTLAFNTIGYASQDILTRTIDAILGTNIGTETPAGARAYIQDVPVTSAGAVTLSADNSARLNSTVSNSAISEASALFNATGAAASAILASNMVSTEALAYVDYNTNVPGTVTAAGAFSATAKSDASIHSNTKLISQSSTSNDGGASVLNETLADLLPADFVTADGAQSIDFNEKVRLDNAYANGGNAGSVYQYKGTTQTLDLSMQDYSDLGLWKEVVETQIIPQGNNITDSDSIAVGGIVVRNDVKNNVKAFVTDTTLTAASVAISATNNSVLNANIDATVSSSGGSAYGSGTSLAVNGTIATNTVQAHTDAFIKDATVTTTAGGLSVNASNSAAINADAKAATSTGDTAVGVTLAFNTVGYNSQDLLTRTIDAILATNIGTADPARAHAYVLDVPLTIAGPIDVTATNGGSITSNVGNETTSAASALVNASDMATSGTLASNMVSTDAKAYIDYTTTAMGNVSAGGAVTISASDTAAITSNNRLVASSSTVNDAGASILNTLVNTLLNEYEYTTLSGTQSVEFGEKIRLDDAYAGGGTAGGVYQYMGQTASLDLGTQDYSDFGFWKELAEFNIIPPGLNVTGSESIAVGAVISRNDVQADVDAYLDNQTTTAAGNLSVTAIENATINSTIESVASSSGGSAYGTGTSLAINGTIAGNVIQSTADALITNSVITTTAAGNVSVDAQNTAKINAKNEAATMTGDTGVGVILAFNTVGYEGQNILFSAIDALLNTNIGTQNPAHARARIIDTPVTSAGNISVTSANTATITAVTTSDAVSEASALIDATGAAASAVLASNMVSSFAESFIDDTTPQSPKLAIQAANGTITVTSTDTASITSSSTVIASSTTVNDGGVGVIGNILTNFLDDYNFTTESGTQTLGGADFKFTSSQGTQTVETNDRVLVSSGHAAGGVEDTVYQYLGANGSIDLANEDFTDETRWFRILRRNTDKVRVGNGYANGGVVGGVYRYLGAPAMVDLSMENYTSANWESLTQETGDLIPNIGNVTDSDSIAVGGLVVRNDVISHTLAKLEDLDLDAQGVTVTATENALISAQGESTASSSGGSAFGTGTSLAVNASIATNVVQSHADAFIQDSDVNATAGNVAVSASNTSEIDATILASTATGDTAVGVTFALNALGYKSQNILFNTIDALLNTNIGNEDAARAHAYIVDTPVVANGNISVTANSAQRMNATVSNAAVSEASALFGATGMATTAILASNMVSSSSQAYIDFTGTSPGVVTAGGDLTVSSMDAASINSNTKLVASSTTTNDGGAAVLNETIGDLLPSDFVTTDGSQQILFGQKVRLPDGYMNGGNGGTVYKYLGTTQTLDLSIQDYSDLGFWVENLATTLIPQGNNISDSDSIGIGGSVVRNDLKSDSDAYIDNSTVNANSVTVTATEDASLIANTDSAVSSSGGSAYGSGTSLAVNGTISTNVAQSQADAYITDSSVTTPMTTGGNLTVTATNDTSMDATVQTMTSSGDTAVGVILAFNTIGFESQNLLFNTIDALLNTNIGTKNAARAHARVVDTPLNINGNISVTASTTGTLNATVGNEATSAASALVNATGASGAGVLASNMVLTDTEAYIDYATTGMVTAGGTITVDARDTATITSDSKLIASSSTVNDAGASILNSMANKLLDEYDFTQNSGTRNVDFGDKVRLSQAFGNGDADTVYQFMGQDGSIDIGAQDFSDFGLWKKLDSTNIIPTGLNVTGSDSIAVGVIIVRNDVQGAVDAYLDDQTTNAGGTVTVRALENVTLNANVESVASSSGGSAYGTGTSLAITGTIATNIVQSEASARITDSSITTTALGDVIVDAQNTSSVDAKVSSALTTGDTGIGVLIAFNTLGWQAQNVLFSAIDALVGTNIGTENPASVEAKILNTTVNAAGNISVTAVGNMTFNADISNVAESSASALVNATGLATSGALASNMVSSEAVAFIDFTVNTPGTITAVGDVTIAASDTSDFNAITKVLSSSETTNDLGLGIIADTLTLLDDYQFTNESGTQNLSGIDIDFNSTSGSQAVKTRDRVFVDAGHTAGGNVNTIYKFLGADATIDLATEDFSDVDRWTEVTRRSTQKVRLGPNFVGMGDVGSVYRYLGSDAMVDLGAENYNDTNRWEKITNSNADWIPSIGNITGSDSISVGALVSRNDVRSDVDAFLDQTTLNAASLTVTATESALIEARTEGTTTSSGGSAFGTGTSLAVNAMIATNMVLANADASVTNSSVTTNGAVANVIVTATNDAGIEATVLGSVQTGDTAVGVTLAFNTVGYEAQNILFQTLDALIGTDIGNQQPSGATAKIVDTNVVVTGTTGNVTVTATNSARINSTVSNAAESNASALFNATGMAVSAILASNMVSSEAQAFIDFTGNTPGTINPGTKGSVSVSATDSAIIHSNTKLVASSTTTNDGGVSVLKETFSDGLSADFNADEGSRAIKFGHRVRLPNTYANGGTAGSIYKYFGQNATIDLSAEDYSDLGFWREDIATSIIPGGLNISDSDSIAVGGVVVRNDARSNVDAYIDNATVTATTVSVTANETATITATLDSSVNSSGGSAYGSGTSIAVNASIATNLILSDADAYISNSSVTTNAGDVVVTAMN
jgi:hypothetical protein